LSLSTTPKRHDKEAPLRRREMLRLSKKGNPLNAEPESASSSIRRESRGRGGKGCKTDTQRTDIGEKRTLSGEPHLNLATTLFMLFFNGMHRGGSPSSKLHTCQGSITGNRGKPLQQRPSSTPTLFFFHFRRMGGTFVTLMKKELSLSTSFGMALQEVLPHQLRIRRKRTPQVQREREGPRQAPVRA
jgi:hypothetical protein